MDFWSGMMILIAALGFPYMLGAVSVEWTRVRMARFVLGHLKRYQALQREMFEAARRG